MSKSVAYIIGMVCIMIIFLLMFAMALIKGLFDLIPVGMVLTAVVCFGAKNCIMRKTDQLMRIKEYNMYFKISAKHFEEATDRPWVSEKQTDYRVTVLEDEKIIHLSAQGSTSKDENIDWWDDFDFRINQPPETWFPDKKIKVHSGFLRQYKNVRDILMDLAYQYPDYAIRVDGYSLGASWPQIFVQDVLYHFPGRDIQAILYEPGNPWRKLSRADKKALKKHIQFVRSIWDPVTWMRVLFFFRYGKSTTIGKWYRVWPLQHLGDEVIKNLIEKFGE